jgi:hypothetical protein
MKNLTQNLKNMSKEYKPFGIGLGVEQLPTNEKQTEQLWDLLKPVFQEMNDPKQKNETQSAITEAKRLGFVPGVRVKLINDDEIGEVEGYNQAVGGFYSGSRYPILVRWERGVFEYGVNDLELVETEEVDNK